MGRAPEPVRFHQVILARLLNVSVAWLAGSIAQGAVEPLRVSARVDDRTPYVGQAILLEVAAVAEEDAPRVGVPRVEGADVARVGSGREPISVGAIGAAVFRRYRYIATYRIIPRRPGPLAIPPVTVRLVERTGASPAIRLPVSALPADRPRNFLGGVGEFEVRAEAVPSSVRLGQVFEFRIILEGEGARDATRAPDLAILDRNPLGLQIRSLPAEATAEPPTRTFRASIRPTKSGRATLPPIVVAGFDPSSGRYASRVTSGIAIRVAEVPAFDPKMLDEDGIAATPTPIWPFAAAFLISMIPLIRLARRSVARRRAGPRATARRIARGLAGPIGADEAAGKAVDGLIAVLQAGRGRPTAALTPREASEGIGLMSGDADLAGRAARLVEEADRARYSAQGDAGPGELAAEARRFFEDLARRVATRA